jgi:2-polyprenyl-3-methyl-5-hydroxy-6-metoxy-1,4-benzoquinol methylase
VSVNIRVKHFLFQLLERIRRVIHFHIASPIRRLTGRRQDGNLSEYYKLYDKIYTLSDSPEFVSMYKNRDLIRRDFFQHCQNKIIPSTGSLLDIGCGEGGNAIYFQSQGYSVSGVDASENAIRLAKKNAMDNSDNIVFEVADVLNMDTDGKKYDICTDIGCLHMLVFASHRKKYLEVVRGLLAKNGVFYLFQSVTEKDVTVNHEEKYVADRISFQNRRMLDSGKIVQHGGCGAMPVSLVQYCEELKTAGFELKHSELVRTPTGLFASLLAIDGTQ